MNEFFNSWLYDASNGKLIAFIIGIIIMELLFKLFKKQWLGILS